MFKLTMKAGAMADFISKMTVRESGGTALFSPLIATVDVKKKRIDWAWITAEQTAFTKGECTKLDISGDSGDYVIDTELAAWCKELFGAEEKITLVHNESTVTLKGDKFEAQYTPTDADAARVEKAQEIKFKDGKPVIGALKFEDNAELNISELAAIIKPTTLVYGSKDIKVVKLSFSKKSSTGTIGSLEAHSKGITRPLEAKVDGSFEVILGQHISEVLAVLSGKVTIYGSEGNMPIWVVKEEENMRLGYMIAPYQGEEDTPEEPEEEPEEDDIPEIKTKKNKKSSKKEEPEEETDGDIEI